VKRQPKGRARGADQVRRDRDSIIEQDGRWTAHDIELAPGVMTLGAEVPDYRLRRIVQTAADISGKPLNELRVLDLACLEGQFGIEFAAHGADVVAIEGRDVNLRKTRFAVESRGLANLDIRKADVRDLNAADFGTFDVVLCLGLLYHLDSPEVMELVSAIAEVCTGLAIFDTHLSQWPRAWAEWNGNRYRGEYWREYSPGTRLTKESRSLWSSIGNERSFLFTKASLTNLLRHTGFTSVYESLNPYECHSEDWPLPPRNGQWAEWQDRSTFIAVKGERQPILTSPLTHSAEERDRAERPRKLRTIPLALACRVESAMHVASRVARWLRRRPS
jgi:2-polyprenyl-3-methyl-5-hydroxy-6-metoxy-1,4-benzoquinol methylase